jgi:hypothetical protein
MRIQKVRNVPALVLVTMLFAPACNEVEDDGMEDDNGRGGSACERAGTGGQTGGGGSQQGGSGGQMGTPVPLKEAKLIIEHNATDEDTGFQGFIDSEGWRRIDVTGPEGRVLSFEGHGALSNLGLTELFFETVEPENAVVPLDEILSALPAGEYTFQGPTVDGGHTLGTAILTHDIPAGPVLVSPEEGATVPTSNLVMSWEPVEETITGDPVNVVRYQLIVEKDEEPQANLIGKISVSMYVPPSVTSVTIPREFLEPATPYLWEVLAIEESGNQTLSSGAFSTE